ncbi:MAG: HAD family hydrolase [Peptococcaceae bacterium]|nr:HAD family hydrolase [Peptococcaceae bacterium]
MGAVLFDIGSTLVRGPELSPATMIARLLGLADSDRGRVADIIMCRPFRDARQVCACLKHSLPAARFPEDGIEKIWLEQESAPEEIPGATEAVRRVKRAGFKVGLVSDIWEPYFKGFMAACRELAAMVDFAGLSFREGVRKPSARLLERAVEVLEVDPGRTWMVGDTYANDLAPAIDMGMRTVWVLSRPEKEYPAMEAVLKGRLPRPDIIVDTVADLVRIDLRDIAPDPESRIQNPEFRMGRRGRR